MTIRVAVMICATLVNTQTHTQWRHCRGGRTAPGDTIQGGDSLCKLFAAEFTKSTGETITWKVERVRSSGEDD